MSATINQTDIIESAPSKIQRKSNVERSANTRSKVIRAAVQCLYELGYEGTTVILVAKKAGVSRGAAQHQFPSKVDLMMAVVERVMDTQSQLRQQICEQLPHQENLISYLVESSWAIQSQPENLALIEIMMATRNDEVLGQRFEPYAKRIAGLSTWGAECIASLAGIELQPEIEALVKLHFAAMRGISLDYLMNKDEDSAKSAVNLLISCQQTMIDKLVAESSSGKAQDVRTQAPETIS